jgi:hypothetical protein
VSVRGSTLGNCSLGLSLIPPRSAFLLMIGSCRLRLREEVEILQHLNTCGGVQPNVLTFVDSWEEDDVLYIQTELCELGNFARFLWDFGRVFPRLDEGRIWKVMVDLSSVCGMCFELAGMLTDSVLGSAIYPRRRCHSPRLEAVKYIPHGLGTVQDWGLWNGVGMASDTDSDVGWGSSGICRGIRAGRR